MPKTRDLGPIRVFDGVLKPGSPLKCVALRACRLRISHTVAVAAAAAPAVSSFGHSYATPYAAAAASTPVAIPGPASPARPSVDPLERSHAAVELAQAVTAQRRTQLAALAAVDAKQRQTMERYREIKEAGEARVAVAQRDLEKAQTELRQTTMALDNAQTVLAERSTRLNEARGKLATLMSMTRDLLRLVKPVTDMRAAARSAAEQASLRLSSLGAAPGPSATPAGSSPAPRVFFTGGAAVGATPPAAPPSTPGYAAAHAGRVEGRTGVPLRPDLTAPRLLAPHAGSRASPGAHVAGDDASESGSAARTPAGAAGARQGGAGSMADIEARLSALSARLQL